jgi:lipoate-protein ligase A
MPLCFLQESPLDILIGDRKVAAFAQRITARAVFQHGSVMVERMPGRVTTALVEAGIGANGDWVGAGEKTASLADYGATTPGSVKRAVLKEASRAFQAGVSGSGRRS